MGLDAAGPVAGPDPFCIATAEGDRDAHSIPSRFFILKIAWDENTADQLTVKIVGV